MFSSIVLFNRDIAIQPILLLPSILSPILSTAITYILCYAWYHSYMLFSPVLWINSRSPFTHLRTSSLVILSVHDILSTLLFSPNSFTVFTFNVKVSTPYKITDQTIIFCKPEFLMKIEICLLKFVLISWMYQLLLFIILSLYLVQKLFRIFEIFVAFCYTNTWHLTIIESFNICLNRWIFTPFTVSSVISCMADILLCYYLLYLFYSHSQRYNPRRTWGSFTTHPDFLCPFDSYPLIGTKSFEVLEPV